MRIATLLPALASLGAITALMAAFVRDRSVARLAGTSTAVIGWLGLVGGSDHSSDAGPNHFCLTGFWVDEVTPEAVWEALWSRRTLAFSNGKISI